LSYPACLQQRRYLLWVRGRLLFGPGANYFHLSGRFASGAIVKSTKLTMEFDYDAFLGLYGENALALFLIDENGNLTICSTDSQIKPRIGQTLISLVNPVQEPPDRQPTGDQDSPSD
jgi:hypothetical protein